MDSLVKQRKTKAKFWFRQGKVQKDQIHANHDDPKNKKKGKWSATTKKRGALYRPTPMEK